MEPPLSSISYHTGFLNYILTSNILDVSGYSEYDEPDFNLPQGYCTFFDFYSSNSILSGGF
jgi:hypothetical protein